MDDVILVAQQLVARLICIFPFLCKIFMRDRQWNIQSFIGVFDHKSQISARCQGTDRVRTLTTSFYPFWQGRGTHISEA